MKVDQSGETLETLAKEFGLTLGRHPRSTCKAPVAGDLGASKELQALVFGDAVLGEHKIGGPMLMGDDRLVLVKDLSHSLPAPSRWPAFTTRSWPRCARSRAARRPWRPPRRPRRSLQAGKDFDAVAKELGVTAEAARFVGRAGPFGAGADPRGGVQGAQARRA